MDARSEDALTVDLLVKDALVLATMDSSRREIEGGWVAITDGLVSHIGAAGEPPPAAQRSLYGQ